MITITKIALKNEFYVSIDTYGDLPWNYEGEVPSRQEIRDHLDFCWDMARAERVFLSYDLSLEAGNRGKFGQMIGLMKLITKLRKNWDKIQIINKEQNLSDRLFKMQSGR